MLERFILNTLKKVFYTVKRKKLVISDKLSLKDIVLFFYHKGFKNLIRGLLKKPFLNSTGLLFLGKNVNIKFKHKLILGKSCYIGDYSLIDCMSKGGVTLGNNVTVREFAWVQLSSSLSNPGESITVGNNTYIGPFVKLGAGAAIKIGCFCQIGANVSFIAENHEFDEGLEIYQQSVSRKGIIVEDDCWIGNNVTILDGVTIGEGCVIGAGAVVTKSIPRKSIAVGVPAKVISSR